MVRGALEVLTDKEVAGWLYSASVDLHGRVVLAFAGTRCVGAGMVEIFRQDLKAANLGHGKYGFRFAIDTTEVEPGATVVRLEGSDMALLHAGSRVCAAAAQGVAGQPTARA